MSVHDVAAAGFGAEAAAYERGRPTYPADAVAWLAGALGHRTRRVVADVAAGTGKLTRLLRQSRRDHRRGRAGRRMRAQSPRPRCPGVHAVSGAIAEALPFAIGTLDAVTVAQAIHWFDRDAALARAPPRAAPGVAASA